MGIKSLFIFIFISFFAQLSPAIIGAIPGPIPSDHPASYNTVALIKPETNGRYKIFCSGSILSSQLILTAKHCIAELKSQDFFVYFGPDTNNVNPQWMRPVRRQSTYGPQDWKSFFPSYDLAWVEIQGALPSGLHLRPLPILANPKLLSPQARVYMAGFGNQSARPFEVIAGERKHVDTQFQNYMDTPQVSSLVLLEGTPGHSNCHGDSGGPAYVSLDNPQTGNKDWYIFGAAAGFDVALTPKTYVKMDDKDFPYRAYCDRSQTLYTFAGDYIDWLEQSSGHPIAHLGDRRSLAPGVFSKTVNDNSFASLCETADFAHTGWLTIRQLMVQAMEKEVDHHTQQKIFLDCNYAEAKIAELTELRIDDKALWGDLSALRWVHALKSLSIDTPILNLNLSFIQDLSLETLRISKNHLSIEDLDLISLGQSIQSLSLSNNSITQVFPLNSMVNLESLDVSSNSIQNIQPLAHLTSLKLLNISRNHVRTLEPLRPLAQLEVLVANSNQITSPAIPFEWPRLKEAYFANNLLTQVDFLKDSPLARLNVRNNPIETLDIGSSFASLTNLQR